MDDRQCTTMLAALRFFQRNRSSALVQMSGHFKNVLPLTELELDELCEGINVGKLGQVFAPLSKSDQAEARVIVVVEGGLVQTIFADRPLNVDVLDHDNWEVTDRTFDPETWQRFADLAQEIDEGQLLEQVY